MVVLVVRVSAGTQKLLGLKKIRVEAPMRMAYLMVSEGRCTYNCDYCTQARSAEGKEDRLSRVVWPRYELSEIVTALKKPDLEIGRICLQVTSNPASKQTALALVETFSEASFPISVSIRPETADEVGALMDCGAERVGIAVDAIGEELFARVRSGSFGEHINLLYEAAELYPGRITTHAIVGIGESDCDLIDFIANCYSRKIGVGLFSFTPVKGTAMSKIPQPPLERYRRIQLARFLIEKDMDNIELLSFDDDGNLLPLKELISDNSSIEASWRTSGCPDCTRPFYNERPGHEHFNVFV